MTTRKTAKVIKELRTNVGGIEITVPEGAIVSNQTADGFDDNYRFWVDYPDHIEKDSVLLHNLMYCGLNIPSRYCEEYKKDFGDTFDEEGAIRRTYELVQHVCSEDHVKFIVRKALRSGAVDKTELKNNYRFPKIMAYIIGMEVIGAFEPLGDHNKWYAENIYACI